MAFDILVQLL